MKLSFKYYLITTVNKKQLTGFFGKIDADIVKYYEKIDTCKFKIRYNNYLQIDRCYNNYNINTIKTFDNLFLDIEVENKIKTLVNSLKNKKNFELFGIPRKVGILIHGMPGTGKTSTIFAIANYLSRDIYNLNLNLSGEDFRKQVTQIGSKKIVCINDIDTISSVETRLNSTESDNKMIGLQDILEVLDGYTVFNKCVIVMTTNYKEKI